MLITKIIYPISIAAACSAIPNGALPFKLTFQSFLILILTMMVLLQVLFFAVNLLRHPWDITQKTGQCFAGSMNSSLKRLYEKLFAHADLVVEKAMSISPWSSQTSSEGGHQLPFYIRRQQQNWPGSSFDSQSIPGDRKLTKKSLKHDLDGISSQKEIRVKNEERDIDCKSSPLDYDDGREKGEFSHTFKPRNDLDRTGLSHTTDRSRMLKLLPLDLRQVLHSIPKEHIRVSYDQDLSITNRIKGWIEDHTQVKWNWWPLEPRKRMLLDDEARISWNCVSHVHISAIRMLKVYRLVESEIGRKYLPSNVRLLQQYSRCQ